MAQLTTEDLRMRQFLLGELNEKQREEIEQLVLSEGNTREKLSMAEDDLIEEYLEGLLQGEELDRFLREFLAIPHQRNKLRIAKSLRRFARREGIDGPTAESGDLTETDGDAESGTQDAAKPPIIPFYRSPLAYVPAAAVIVLAIAIGVVWYIQYRGTLARESRRQEIERELAQLNGSTQPNLPADQISTLIVLPFSPRSAVASVASSFKRPVLELWLIPSNRQSQRYEALLQKVGSEDQFRIPNLQLQDRGAGDKAVRLRIPTPLLTRGMYRVQLSDLLPDGTVAKPSEYNFEIQ